MPANPSHQARIAEFDLVSGEPDIPGLIVEASGWYTVRFEDRSFVHLHERYRSGAKIVCDLIGFVAKVNALMPHSNEWGTPAQAAGGTPPAWMNVDSWPDKRPLVPVDPEDPDGPKVRVGRKEGLHATIAGYDHHDTWEAEVTE